MPTGLRSGALVAAALCLGACGVGGGLALSGGGGGGGGDSRRKPPPPQITIAVPNNGVASNFVSIPIVLRDPRVKSTVVPGPPQPGEDPGREGGDDDPRVRIFPEFRAEGSDVFVPMTDARVVGSDGTRGLSLGSHSFIWNTVVDLPGFVGDVTVRVRGEYEPTAGFKRKFRPRDVRFRIDNRLTATVFGGDVFVTADVETFPIDLRADGGSMLIASSGAGIVERVNPFGNARRVVGIGVPGDTGDGGDPGVAQLSRLGAIAFDGANGLVYSLHQSRIRVTNTLRDPTTFGVDFLKGRTIDTPPQLASIAGLANPGPLRLHPSGALLYATTDPATSESVLIAFNPQPPPLVGNGNDIVFENAVIPPGASVAVLGGGSQTADGAEAEDTLVEFITACTVGPNGGVYFSEFFSGLLRVYNPGPGVLALPAPIGPVAAGTVRTIAGGGGVEPVRDGDGGPATGSTLGQVRSIDISSDMELFLADTSNVRVRMINLGATDTTFAGTTIAPGDIDRVVGVIPEAGETGGGIGSPAAETQLGTPNAVAVGIDGTIVVADQRRVILVNGRTTTVTAYGRTALATRTTEIYDAAERNGLPLGAPRAVHSRGPEEVFFTDRSTVRVLNLDESPEAYGGAAAGPGEVAVIGGGAVPGFAGDGGSARSAAFDSPAALATDGALLLFVADTGNDRIRLINIGDPNLPGHFVTAFGVATQPGGVYTIVGGGPNGLADDGDLLAPTQAQLDAPQGLAVSAGLLFVADTDHHRVRCVNPGAIDETVAGVLVPAGTIRTILGTGAPGFTPDGAVLGPTNAPKALAVDGRGILYIGESGNHRVRALNLGLTDEARAGVVIAGVSVPENEIATLVGTGVPGNFGDGGGGPEALIDDPVALQIQRLSDGTPALLHFADAVHHVVRALNLTDTDLIGAIDAERRAAETIPANGIVSIAGGPNRIGINNAAAFAGDGEVASEVRFAVPSGIAITSSAHFFVADRDNNRLRRFIAPPLAASTGD